MGVDLKGGAFFDLDRTVIPGSSLLLMVLPLARRGFIGPGKLARAAWSSVLFRFRGQTDRGTEFARSEFLKFGEGWKTRDADQTFAELVLPAIERRIRREIVVRMDLHRARGEPIYLVSSAPQRLVEMVADCLGIDGAAGTVAEAIDGVYTGSLARPFCHGEEKTTRLGELAEMAGISLEKSWAYADSISDLPMLSAVGHPVAVAPDRKLSRIAVREDWEVLLF